MNHPYRVPVTTGDRIKADLALQMVAAVTGVPPERMSGPRLAPDAVRARRLALYLTHVGQGWPLERVSHAFGVNRTTASSACRWVEDERDSPRLDRLLDRLETLLRELCEAPRLELAR